MSEISDKIANIRGSGHHVGPELEEILTAMDKRISALEKPKPEVKPAQNGGAARGPMQSVVQPQPPKPEVKPVPSPFSST
jgi:hypothetical protein